MNNATRMTIRMYRQGLGDCFLLSIPKKSGGEFHMVVDCGLIQGAPQDAGDKMPRIVADIGARTSNVVDVLVATHQHWDHMSGFVAQLGDFQKLKVRSAWLGWIENPSDAQAKQLAQGRGQAVAALGAAIGLLHAAGAAALADDVTPYAENLGIGAAGGIGQAMDNVRALAGNVVTYCDPSGAPLAIADTDVRVFVLGPPRDQTLLHRMSASASSGEMYAIAASVGGAFGGDAGEPWIPFAGTVSAPIEAAKADPFFIERYFGGVDAGWRNIDSAWLAGASDLAIQLDSFTNNTSLVLAFEFPGGDVALFPGDAQIGSWESWLTLRWKLPDAEVTGADLLRRCVFYKVGHHGSHNATMRQGGLETMTALHTAMVPVDHAMAVKKNWTRMPLPEILTALTQTTGSRVIRVDDQALAPGIGAVSNELYYEVSI